MKQRINSMSYQMHILTVIFFRDLKFFKFSGISGTRVRVQIYKFYTRTRSGTGTALHTSGRVRVWISKPVPGLSDTLISHPSTIIPFLQIILKIGRQRRSSVHFQQLLYYCTRLRSYF